MTRLAVLAVLAAAAPALVASGCGGEEARGRGDPVAGRQVFTEAAEPACGRCHTLADADAEGTIGPSLDFLRPGYEQVLNAVREGPGLMPAYDDALGEDELHDLAAYVSGAAAE